MTPPDKPEGPTRHPMGAHSISVQHFLQFKLHSGLRDGRFFLMTSPTARIQHEILRLPLGQIASIQVGHTFRSGVTPSAHGAVCVIQMKDVPDDTLQAKGSLTRIDFGPIREAHQVALGDLLFRSRGTRLACAIVTEIPPNTMISAPLYRIRITDARAHPGYLSWFINSQARNHLESRAEGSDLKMVGIPTLKELVIALPSLEKQTKIAELAQLARRETQLVQTISNKRSNLIASCLARALQET